MLLVSHYTCRVLNHLQQFQLFRHNRRITELIETFSRRQPRQRVSTV